MLESLMMHYKFIQNPVNGNKICNPSKFDVSNSTKQRKVPYEFIFIKSEFYAQTPFIAKFHNGLKLALMNRDKSKGHLRLNRTYHS